MNLAASSRASCALTKAASEHALRLFQRNIRLSALFVSDGGGRADDLLFAMATMMFCQVIRVLAQCDKIVISASQLQ